MFNASVAFGYSELATYLFTKNVSMTIFMKRVIAMPKLITAPMRVNHGNLSSHSPLSLLSLGNFSSFDIGSSFLKDLGRRPEKSKST